MFICLTHVYSFYHLRLLINQIMSNDSIAAQFI